MSFTKKFLLGSLLTIQLTSSAAMAKKLKPHLFKFTEVSGSNCDKKIDAKDEAGEFLAPLCPDEFRRCKNEKRCFFNDGENRFVLEYIRKEIFKKISNDKCIMAEASPGVCWDPYYSVRASAKFYKIGDVIYVDAIRSLKMPDGSYHNGYLIVRGLDKNSSEEGQIEFFVGAANELDENNPFVKAGLNKQNTQIEYSLADKKQAEAIQKIRNYPEAVVANFIFAVDAPSDTNTKTQTSKNLPPPSKEANKKSESSKNQSNQGGQ